jgi:broad specificity phosphatase PhoE
MLTLKPFYLMRHGESLANIRNITSGSLDVSLTVSGHKQAQEASKLIANMPKKINTIYHSSLIRAKNTALLVGSVINAIMIENSGLNEHNFGEWEGEPWDVVLEQLILGNEPPQGETNKEFITRVKNTINAILLQHSSDNPPLLVAHGGVFYAISRLYKHKMHDVENCKLYFFEPTVDLSMPWITWSVKELNNKCYFERESLFYI